MEYKRMNYKRNEYSDSEESGSNGVTQRYQSGQQEKVIAVTLEIDNPGKITEMCQNNYQIIQSLGLKNVNLQGQPSHNQAGTQTSFDEENKSNESSDLDYENSNPAPGQLQFHPSSQLIQSLSYQVTNYVDYVEQYNAKNRNVFQQIILKLTKLINDLYASFQVEVFGSYATQLSLPDSDIDIVIKCTTSALYIPDILKNLASKLNEQPFIDEAKTVFGVIPLIKTRFIKKFLNKKVDISIQDAKHNGLATVSLIQDWLLIHQPLKPLVLVLKQLLYSNKSNDPYQGGLSSYGLILMIVAFLERKENSNNISLGALLLDFLNLYGLDLDYMGKTIHVQHPKSIDYPSLFFDPQNFAFFPQHGFVLLDPLNKVNNIARSSYNILKIKNQFGLAFSLLMNNYSLEKLFNNPININPILNATCPYKNVMDQAPILPF